MLDTFDISTSRAVAVLSCIFLVWYCCRLTYNVYFHPLAKFPGPKLAGASRWYEGYYDILVGEGGQYMYKVQRMHEEYGPIVRVAPNELHVDKPEFREKLYAIGPKRNKVPYMIDIFGTPLAIFGTEHHDLHRLRRSALNPFFSRRSVTQLESLIQSKVRKMSDRMSTCYEQGRPIRLRHMLASTIVDVTTEFSFGKCVDALDGPDFSPEWEDMMVGVSEFVPIARSFPGVVQIAQALPISVVRLINPLMASFSEFEQLVRRQVEDIFVRYSESTDEFERSKGTGIPTIFHEILASNIPEHEKTVDRMTQEALSVISAASETTSSVMAAIVFYVASNRSYAERIRRELDEAIPSPTGVSEWKKLKQLPFLSALIKEGLRIASPVSARLPLTSLEPLQFEKWTIPAGTYVGMSTWDALYHPEIFPSPREFLPDRWLEANSDALKRMEMAFVPFGRGPRMCIGLNLAYANMYHIMSAIFRRFDLDLIDTKKERDIEVVRDYFVAKPSRSSKGVTIKITGEAR